MKTYKVFESKSQFLRVFNNKHAECWRNHSTHNERNAADFKASGKYLIRAEVFAKGGLYDTLIN